MYELLYRFWLIETEPMEKQNGTNQWWMHPVRKPFHQAEGKVITGIKLTGLPDQYLCKVTVNTPITFFVGISNCASGNFVLNANVVEFVLHCT